jgi:predicted NACHT family NTPase|tara:strand:- start:40 stop:333 length:294 start_codon:yes stop_codon:yes gene_type:complete
MDIDTLTIVLSPKDINQISEANRKIFREEIEAYAKSLQKTTKFISHQEACKELQCSPPTLTRWRLKSYITGVQIGRKYFYTDEEVNRAKTQGLLYKH